MAAKEFRINNLARRELHAERCILALSPSLSLYTRRRKTRSEPKYEETISRKDSFLFEAQQVSTQLLLPPPPPPLLTLTFEPPIRYSSTPT